MSKIIKKIFISTIMVSTTFSLLMGAESIEISPSIDKKIFHEQYVSVTIKLNNKNISKVLIVTDKNEHYPIELTTQCDNVCSKIIKLRLGENSIRVEGYIGEELAYEVKNELYCASQAFREYKEAPIKYKERFFHTDKNEKLCAECHDMSNNEQKKVAFVDVKDSNCFVCHKAITLDRYAHAPSANWLCTSCHTGEIENKSKNIIEKSKFIAPKQIASACFSCHDKNKQSWDTKKHKHFPVEAGMCTRCHNPHSSDNKMFLRVNSSFLCLECHADKKLSQQIRGNSKCPGEQKDGCTECHNPHASDYRFLLKSPHVDKKIDNNIKGK
ncbi:cytochrome c3 family protein [Sulfurimonas sp.]|uniref:cytochrome c3 family protein n=1 Tax=Sulfurimonas sp. TaxID=2022749 RepID=UPI0025EA22F5|nr:cytochrome c3 family protein [Sulfurimonas sp.]